MEKMTLICFKEPSITSLVMVDLNSLVRRMKKERPVWVKDPDGHPMALFPSRRCNICYAREASEDEAKAYMEMKEKKREAMEKEREELSRGGKRRIEPVHTTLGRHGKRGGN